MVLSKGLLYLKEISASSASVLAQSLLGKQLPEAGRKVHAEVSLQPRALGMVAAADEGRFFF